MLSFSWGAPYEALPTTGLNRSLADDDLRQMRRGVREYMETEHNWGPYRLDSSGNRIDDGSHLQGDTTVLKLDICTVADMNALGIVPNGSLYLVRDGTLVGNMQLYVYITGTGWVKMTEMDHSLLSGLTADDHTQYVRKDVANTMVTNLDMGNNKITFSAAGATVRGGLVTWKHTQDSNPHTFDYGATKHATLTHTKFRSATVQVSVSVPAGAISDVQFHNYAMGPNLYEALGRTYVATPVALTDAWGFYNSPGAATTVKIGYRYFT